MTSDPRPLLLLVTAWLVAISLLASCTGTPAMTSPPQFFASGPQAALEIAIRADDLPGIRDAVQHGASVNATGKFNITPLMVAVDAQRLRAVQALLDAGALPNALAQDGNGPVSLAVRSYLDKPHGREIMLAIFRGGGNPDTRQPDGDPVLMRFVYDRDVADLALMKRLGANLDILDRGGDPVVTKIAMSQAWDMVCAFIDLGAEPDYENGRSRQPLSLALKARRTPPGQPVDPDKLRVWQLLKDRGVALPPLP
jgi:ankyrin repeat protein